MQDTEFIRIARGRETGGSGYQFTSRFRVPGHAPRSPPRATAEAEEVATV